MKNRLFVGVLVVIGVLFAVGGQACGPGRGCADPNATPVEIISASGDPASGTGKVCADRENIRWFQRKT